MWVIVGYSLCGLAKVTQPLEPIHSFQTLIP